MGMNGWSFCGVSICVTFCKLSLSLSLVEETQFVYRACPQKNTQKLPQLQGIAIYQPCILCQRPASIVNVGWVSCSHALQHCNSALQPHGVPWYLSRFFLGHEHVWQSDMFVSIQANKWKHNSENRYNLSLSLITFICETLLQEWSLATEGWASRLWALVSTCSDRCGRPGATQVAVGTSSCWWPTCPPLDMRLGQRRPIWAITVQQLDGHGKSFEHGWFRVPFLETSVWINWTHQTSLTQSYSLFCRVEWSLKLPAAMPVVPARFFFCSTGASARDFPSPPGSAVLAMVQVEIWSLTLASVKAVGSIAVMAAGGELWRMDIFLLTLITLGIDAALYKVDSLSLSMWNLIMIVNYDKIWG